MSCSMVARGVAPAVLLLLLSPTVSAAEATDAVTLEPVEVTTSKIPMSLRDTAASVTVELSPQHLGSVGLVYSPAEGFQGHAVASFNGTHFLDRLNTVRAGAYTTLDAGIGYRHAAWEVRVDGYNLTDRRDAVAGSELGIDQFYLMPARFVMLNLGYTFGKD